MMFSQAAITIPLREMGFDNFYHFIYNCPDVCSLKQLPDKEDLYLFVSLFGLIAFVSSVLVSKMYCS